MVPVNVMGAPIEKPASPRSNGPAVSVTPPTLADDFNGIVAAEPKIYNDRSLEQMLQQLESQLAQLKAFDNPTLTNRIGTTQGATSQQSSLAAQATARPTPDVTSTVTTGAQAGTQTVTKNPSITPAVPGISDSGAAALPTSFSTSASDALAEEAQLAFQIANLRLLLQESLSDRFSPGLDQPQPKRSVTIGIPISIEVAPCSENAVAEVEVFITTAGTPPRFLPGGEKAPKPVAANSCSEVLAPKESQAPPGVIALLPREKTYNVAAIKDSSTSLGAGAVVANVINLGLNWMGRKQSYYIVQAMDTVAMQRPSQEAATTVLAWQFRPVLGEKTVKPGLRQVFARLSFPVGGEDPDLGRVWVTTTWRHYDQKTGAVGKPMRSKVWTRCFPLVDTGRFVTLTNISWSDLGTGQVSVVVDGEFPPGTSVLLPEGPMSDGSLGFAHDSKRLTFTVAAAQLVRDRIGSLISINDNGTDLKINCNDSAAAAVHITQAFAIPFNATQSKVTVELADGDLTNVLREPPLILMGKHVIGLKDAPFFETVTADGCRPLTKRWKALSFLVSTDDIRQARSLALAHPFCGADFYDTHAIDLPDDFMATQATTLSTSEPAGTEIAISGQNLSDRLAVLINGSPAVLSTTVANNLPGPSYIKPSGSRRAMNRRKAAPPKTSTPAPCGPATLNAALAPTMLLLQVPTCLAAGLKSIVVASSRGEAVTLALDTSDPKLQIKQPDALPQVAAGTQRTLKLTGSNLGLIQDVQFKGLTLQPTLAGDKSYITIVLPDEINTTPGFYVLTAMASDKAKTQVPVVISITPAAKPAG
jgi:hypothetical protein